MPVNAVIDNYGVQQTAAATNQAAVAELREIDKKDQEKRIDERSHIQKLLEAKSPFQASREVLGDLVSKLAGSGIKLEPETFVAKTQRKVKDEYDLMFKSQEDSSDSVQIKSLGQKITAAKKLNQNLKEGKGGQDQNGAAEAQRIAGTLEEFSGTFVQFLVTGGVELKKKVEKLEQQLKQEGFSEANLLSLKQNLRNSIRAQLADQIRESLLKRFFSKEKTLDWIMNDKEAYKSIGFALKSDKLGGWDFGGYNTSLQGTVDEQISEIRSQVRDFVKDEVINTLIKREVSGSKVDAELKRLLELGMKAWVSFQELQLNWREAVIHQGLTPPPPEAYGQSLIEFGQRDKKERTGY